MRSCLCACLGLAMHEFVLCRVELEPSPTPVCFTCISMKQEVIYPSAAATSLSVCLSLPVSPADIDLFAKQGDRQCFQLFQTLCFPFHLYLGKALTPHVAAMCVAFCTWTSPVQSPVCMCVSVRVCLSWKVDVHVDAMCLRVSDPVPNQLCVYFHEQVHAVLCRFTQMYSSLFKLLYIWESLHTLVLFKVFSVLQVCNWELLHTRTRQSSFGASVNRITGK